MKFDEIISESLSMSDKLLNTTSFSIDNKLWNGFFKHKLVLSTAIIGAIVIPWSLFNYFRSMNTPDASSIDSVSSAISEATKLQVLMGGANKYIVLFFIQLLVSYFSNQTIKVLSGKIITFTLRSIIESQLRVFYLSVRNWILELVLGIIIGIIVGIFLPDWVEILIKFLLGSYFVGFLFIDNYNHTFYRTIKESTSIVRQHIGAAIVVGAVAKTLFELPLIGALAVSFICSVATTWHMYVSETNKTLEV